MLYKDFVCLLLKIDELQGYVQCKIRVKDLIRKFIDIEVENIFFRKGRLLVQKFLVDIGELKCIECEMRIKSWYGFLDDYDLDDEYEWRRNCLEEEVEERVRQYYYCENIFGMEELDDVF